MVSSTLKSPRSYVFNVEAQVEQQKRVIAELRAARGSTAVSNDGSPNMVTPTNTTTADGDVIDGSASNSEEVVSDPRDLVDLWL